MADDWYSEASYASEVSAGPFIPKAPEPVVAHGDPKPYFVAGFQLLADQLGASLVGDPLELEHPPADGGADEVQRTTNGLLVWKHDDVPSFTDGADTYYLKSRTQTSATVNHPVSSPTSGAGVPSGGTVWDTLAQCESGGNWHSTSNPIYSGGLQEDSTFWRTYGGTAFAPTPAQATREQQIIVAQRGLAVQGFGAWPACSRRLGLR